MREGLKKLLPMTLRLRCDGADVELELRDVSFGD